MTQVPLPPPPQTGQPIDGWLHLLWRRLTQAGQIFWSSLNFTGSNLTDLVTRNHGDLQNINTATYTHVTAAEYAALVYSSDSRLSDARNALDVYAWAKAATKPVYGNITADGAIGAVAGLPVVTGSSGVLTTQALGAANTVNGINAAGSAPEWKAITAGANVTVTHAAGSITIAATGGGTTFALTMNNSGAGDASGTTFDGTVARTISHNTIGAAASGANTDITSMTALTAPTVAANPVRATDLQVQLATAFTTAGTSTAFTLTPAPAITANAANQRFRVKFNAAAGATPTLAVSGLTALNLKYKDSAGTKQAITSTQVPINWVSDVENDGTDWVVLSVATQDKPSFSAYKTSNQTGIANDTQTLVTWDVEEFDTNDSFASNRFTPKVAGNYLLNAHLSWSTGVDQSPYVIMIYKNGSLYKATRDSFSGSTSTLANESCNQITEIVKANGTTDYFEIYVWHGAGSSQTLNGDSFNSVFSGVLL